MATFATVNTTLSPPEAVRSGDEQTPTTPTPSNLITTQVSATPQLNEESAVKTPTRDSFGGFQSQQPLVEQPVTPSPIPRTQSDSQPSLKRDSLHLSEDFEPSPEKQDVDMIDGDDELAAEDDGSDNDSVTSDSQRPSKKKKGQRFFCTDFPPCQLSFTRSEHLARHIRKHTGERPFQCHCSRRFSRLDNLRQHAQTVHVNEEIPGDSLAATSTRFQRQIRTDRVRPPNSRSRANTVGSNGGHSRGHSRNLSTSSIGSVASSVGMPDDVRRRPQPLAMANDPAARARLSLDTYNNGTGSPAQQQYIYYNQSPTGYSTPTSTTFSTGNESPRFSSGMVSPASTLSRSSYYNGARTSRRLSVPSTQNPFQNPNGGTYPQPTYFGPMGAVAPNNFSQNSSVFGSPTSSVFSHQRRDSEAELEYRRRTWHPGTYTNYAQRPATSGLSYHQTPDDSRPNMSEQPAASQVTRLPGIESFDHAPPSNTRQQSSPMMMEASPRPPSGHRPSDAGLNQGLNRLDIAAANAPPEMQWQNAPPAQTNSQGYANPQYATVAPQQVIQHPASMPEPPVTPKRSKRQAWYGGPVAPNQPGSSTHRPSPEDSGSSDGVPTPGTAQGIEYNPVIVNHQGTGEPYPPGSVPVMTEEQKAYMQAQPGQTYALQAGHDPRFAGNFTQPPNNDMHRLEALVAVATSENRAVERS